MEIIDSKVITLNNQNYFVYLKRVMVKADKEEKIEQQ